MVRREVDRLAAVAAKGAIAGKTLLERQYEQQKLEASLNAHRQRLLLHRLTPEQVQGILDHHKLLKDLTVTAPALSEDAAGNAQGPLQVQQLNVQRGQHVAVGHPLCVPANHAELYIQGKAFEQDIPTLAAAAKQGWAVTAVFQSPENRRQMIPDLKIVYLANQVEVQSRAFFFYVKLPNRVVRDTKPGAGPRFVDWEFKPGQRLRVLVPVEAAAERIVLPVEAVVQDGAETYVF